MKKMVMLAGSIFLGMSLARAGTGREAWEYLKQDTSKYFFSTLTIGYYDHFHKDGDKEKNMFVSAPLCAFRFIGVEPFGTFDGSTVQEWGGRFELQIPQVKSWLRLEPYIFKNEEIDAMGFGVYAQIKIK